MQAKPKGKAKMSNEDVKIETTADADNDVTVEEVQNEVSDDNDETQVESTEDTEEEEQPKTVEEKLAEVEAKYAEKERSVEAMQKKIDRQTAAYNAAQKAIQERDARLAELSNVNKPEVKEPSIDDFDTHEEYVNALADFRAEQRVRNKERELLQKQQQEAMNKMARERANLALQQEAEYIKENPRYEASKSEFESFVQTANVSPAVEQAIVESAFLGNVPAVIDYFGANNGERMDELAKISQMSPIQAGIEIYKIQQKLASKPKDVKENQPLPKPVSAPKGSKKAKVLNSSVDGKDILKWVNS